MVKERPERMDALLRNHRRFLRFLEGRLRSREDAEEILQAAFVRGLERGAELRDDESVVAWFYRILRNALVDHYRRRASGRRAMEVRGRQDVAAVTAAGPALERAVCACVNDLIPLLRPEYADILRRVDLGESTVEESARALRIKPGNARVRLHRARAALRRELERSCRTCAAHGCLDCTCARTEATEGCGRR